MICIVMFPDVNNLQKNHHVPFHYHYLLLLLKFLFHPPLLYLQNLHLHIILLLLLLHLWKTVKFVVWVAMILVI